MDRRASLCVCRKTRKNVTTSLGRCPVKKRLSTQACGPILKLSTWTMSVIRFSAAVREQRQEYLWPTGKLQVRQESLPPPPKCGACKGWDVPWGSGHPQTSTSQHHSTQRFITQEGLGGGGGLCLGQAKAGASSSRCFPVGF